MTDQHWRLEANCLSLDPDEFFPDGKGVHVHPMVWATCRACPVIQQCLDYALAANLTEGVWGGTTPMERRRLTIGDEPPILARRCAECSGPVTGHKARWCGPCADERELRGAAIRRRRSVA